MDRDRVDPVWDTSAADFVAGSGRGDPVGRRAVSRWNGAGPASTLVGQSLATRLPATNTSVTSALVAENMV